MPEIIGVKFKSVGKVYYFDPAGQKPRLDDYVIVETARGVECGHVALACRNVEEDAIVPPLKSIIRIATPKDLHIMHENEKKSRDAFHICLEKIAKHQLDMKLIDVEYTFDRNKILFYFTSDGRVDFRSLVKDLASVFHTRIELRQIGVRDESKMIGGLGVCGRPFCCSSFLGEFQPVSIKMAKEQSLSLNPVKISGTCGRLMCCLKYEQDSYEYLLKMSPKVGAYVQTPGGKGTILSMNLLTSQFKVSMEDTPEAAPQTFSLKDIQVIKDTEVRLSQEEINALKELEKD